MRRLALALLLAAAAVAAAGLVMAPPPARRLDTPGAVPVRGALHVHTRRSDGTGTVDEVAAAAARAGLAFVVFTDHGDATRAPDPPVYRSGVLCVDAVEITTDGGHVVALGLARAPYPLGGEPRDVVEDIRRMGGMSIVTHPASPNPGLRWVEWTAPFDGLEWLNADSEWRDEPRPALARALLTYPFRRPETLATLLDRPAPVVARWDALTARRRVVAVAGADAHARVMPEDDGAAGNGAAAFLRFPSYEQVFRAFSIAMPGLSFSGNAASDAEALIAGLRQGRLYSSIDALAGPAVVTFTGRRGERRAGMGEAIATGQPIHFDVRSNAPAGARITLLKDGALLATADGPSLQRVEPGEPAVYRVEIDLPGAPGSPPVPWILSNPIYVQPEDAGEPAPDPRGPATEFAAVYGDGPADSVAVERSARSEGAFDVVPAVGGTQLSLRFALGGTRAESPYVALAMPAGSALAGYDRLMFTARADGPMRLSVQLRVPEGPAGERWHRSVYLDETPRQVSIFFDEMTPRGATSRRRPVLQTVRDLLFVVDTVNAAPGASGQVWIDDIKYGR